VIKKPILAVYGLKLSLMFHQ